MARAADEEGSTLVELIVSMVVLTVAMAGFASFFVNSYRAVYQQRDQREAAQLANTAMEQIRALKGSSLIVGRGEDASTNQWTNNLPAVMEPYYKTITPVWQTDPVIAKTAGADAALSTATQQMTVNGTLYQRSTYLGGCEIYVGKGEGCVKPVSPAPVDSTSVLKFFRVVVLVTWKGTNCADNVCTHIASTLVSRAPEPIFDIKRPSPVVKATSATFYKGVAGQSFQLTATGGQLPNTWTASTLPAGLSMTTAGVVSGTPTTVGTTTGTVTVTDKLGRTDTASFTWIVILPPTVTVAATVKNHIGETVSVKPTVSGGASPYAWAVTDLPANWTFNTDTGEITGTATTLGTWTPGITATDTNAMASATVRYTHIVYPVVSVAAVADRSINLTSSITVTNSASGGDGTYTWSATGVPTGTSMAASTGTISGTPLVPGRYIITVTATDATGGTGGTASTSFALTVATSTQLNITSPTGDLSTPSGQSVSVPIQSNADLLGLVGPTYTVTGLPPGVKYNSGQGTLTGKPTTPGTYPVTIVAKNLTQQSTYTFIWTVT
ncbi:putative Ig domain-containing protein [Actinoplanes sp. NBRC 101535]|uniref:type IV pilus modification PilV family protein n=1 Tax=Actinoplanes sp. NBRC 101535 TaxID=3032196 RepID=UPI0024A10B25|nr:putative Ig domain-containing protein [Actinoplanes sp. NBRC 101535]GLY05559.1 hypothetical protein Acsp01_59380 [Actinoplanes sp. NBRC 101535]